MYDIIFIGEKNKSWEQIKQRFVAAKHAATITEAKRKSFTKMFWAIPPDLEILDSFDFSYQVETYDQKYVHQFLHNDTSYDGVCLISKSYPITEEEWKKKNFVDQKQIDITASITPPYDKVFISYDEPNADENYQALVDRFTKVLRVHGVTGIHQAHIKAAEMANTNMFWVIDADAVIVDDFNFDYIVPSHQQDHVHVWRSQNPINGLVYGYGGIKLFPRLMTINMDTSKPDMTTSVSSKFIAVNEISNITAFNTDPYSTWRSAFRECCKLSSKVIDRQNDDETNHRLRTWCTVNRGQFGKYAIDGAKQGAHFGATFRGNTSELVKINDFAWLKEKFNARDL